MESTLTNADVAAAVALLPKHGLAMPVTWGSSYIPAPASAHSRSDEVLPCWWDMEGAVEHCRL